MFHFQLRVCHKLTTKLRREVVLGSSCLDDPAPFITVMNFSFDLQSLSRPNIVRQVLLPSAPTSSNFKMLLAVLICRN